MKYTAVEFNGLDEEARNAAWAAMSQEEREELRQNLERLNKLGNSAGGELSAREKPARQPLDWSAAAEIRSKESVALEQIRANTCYGALRLVIDVASVVALGCLGLLAVLATMEAREIYDLVGIGVVWAVAVVLFVLILAVREGMLLLVDIADAQIRMCSESPNVDNQ